MKHLISLSMCFWFLLNSGFNGSTIFSQDKNTTQNNPTNTLPVQVIPSQQVFELFKELNKQGKLIPPAVGGAQYQLKNLNPQNCFGFSFPNGARLMGESSGEYYGLSVYSFDIKPPADFDAIGCLHADGDFIIGGKAIQKGVYAVLANENTLALQTTESKNNRYFSLEAKIDGSLFMKAGKVPNRVPKFSFIEENGSAFLTVEGNKLPVQTN